MKRNCWNLPQRLCKTANHKGYLHFRGTDHIENMVVLRSNLLQMENALPVVCVQKNARQVLFPWTIRSWPIRISAFQIDDTCIGCGQCVKNCSQNNIALENGKPIWGNQCTHCMVCICYCPTEAIEYGKKSIGKQRYHFEQLKMK